MALALTAIHGANLNLFYGFGEGISPQLALPRSVTVVDAVVLLSLLNLAALAWHARVLASQTCPGGAGSGLSSHGGTEPERVPASSTPTRAGRCCEG